MGISKWSYCRSRPQQVLSILEVSTADGLQLVLPLVCLGPAPPKVPLFLRDGGDVTSQAPGLDTRKGPRDSQPRGLSCCTCPATAVSRGLGSPGNKPAGSTLPVTGCGAAGRCTSGLPPGLRALQVTEGKCFTYVKLSDGLTAVLGSERFGFAFSAAHLLWEKFQLFLRRKCKHSSSPSHETSRLEFRVVPW